MGSWRELGRHLSTAVVLAAAAIATVLTMSTAFGAAVAGLLVNLGAPATVTSARYLLAGFAVIRMRLAAQNQCWSAFPQRG